MTIGGGIALIALGAILTYAVEYDLAGLNINVIGVILMIAGAIGLVAGLILYSSRRTAGTTVVEERPVAPRTVERTTTYDQY